MDAHAGCRPTPVSRALRSEALALRDSRLAAGLASYFQATPGGYGEGNEFLGIRVPTLRGLVRPRRRELAPGDIAPLLHDRWHEVRLLGSFAAEAITGRREQEARDTTIRIVLDHIGWLDNWDLIDSCAPPTVGVWLADHREQRPLLDRLVADQDLWHRRFAVIATLGTMRSGWLEPGFDMAEAVLTDPHDLIHKAAGWVLRESGYRDRPRLLAFLDAHAAVMPRVMLRYAIEKFDPELRAHYLNARRRQFG